jgi:transcriptional regulator with XRE-family HTH domain
MKLNFKNIVPGIPDTTKVLDREFTEEEIAKAFGDSLKKLRNYKKLSLNALSKLVDIPNPTINRYESGYHLPLITQGMKLAGFFDLSIECLVFFGLLAINEGEFVEGVDVDIIEVYESCQMLKETLENE